MDEGDFLILAELIIGYLAGAYLYFNTSIENQTAILVMFISYTLSISGLLCLKNGWFDDFFEIIGAVALISCFVGLGMIFSIVY